MNYKKHYISKRSTIHNTACCDHLVQLDHHNEYGEIKINDIEYYKLHKSRLDKLESKENLCYDPDQMDEELDDEEPICIRCKNISKSILLKNLNDSIMKEKLCLQCKDFKMLGHHTCKQMKFFK
jgi:hypothetical protein